MTITIRPAVAADRDALKTLLDLSWRTHWGPHVTAASRSRFDAELPGHGYVDACWESLMVAERDGAVLGMYHLQDGFLHAIHVSPEAIGSGVGRALMQHAETHGAQKLEVRVFNTNALAFYRHRGWQTLEEIDAEEMGTPTRSLILGRTV